MTLTARWFTIVWLSLALSGPVAAQEGIGVLELASGRISDRAMLAAGGFIGAWHYGSDNVVRGVGDLNNDGRDDAILTSDWGIGVVTHDGTAWRLLLAAPNGTRFGSWAFSSLTNRIDAVADFNGDRKDDVLITSGWGMAILTLGTGGFTTLAMYPNGTLFGTWAFSSSGNTVRGTGDFDGDGKAEILVTSGWGIAILTLRGTTLAPLVAAQSGTRFGAWAFGVETNRIPALADFNGDRKDDLLVTSEWGMAILTLGASGLAPVVMQPNGTRFGNWAYDGANQIHGAGDFDGDGRADLLVSSTWGIAVIALRGTDRLLTLMMQPNGTRFGGWALDVRSNSVLGIADLNADRRADVVVRSPWGMGVLTLREPSFGLLAATANGTAAGRWQLEARDQVAGVGGFVATGAARILIQKGPQPLAGFADLHTHPMARWAFGAELFWGDVDGDPATALGECRCFHRGWDVSNNCGNTYREEMVNSVETLNAHHHTGSGSGFTAFQSFPKYHAVLHQQMWYEWIRRARDGGLRVMVALAVNSHVSADASETAGPNDDLASMNLQLTRLSEFVGRHPDFMEIARTPADLRRIAASGRLAVVVGIEMDNIGNFYNPADRKGATYNRAPTNADVQAEIDRLYAAGVRYVIPIHITNNAFGGSALYDDVFNVANKYNTGTMFTPEVVDTRATGIAFKLKAPRMNLDAIGRFAFFLTGPVLPEQIMPSRRVNYPEYPDPGPGLGHRNSVGLTDRGRFAVRYMMRKGMLIDLDHMSERAVEEVLGMAEAFDYPVHSGHNGPRGATGNENQRTREQYARIRDLDGIIGLGHGGAARPFARTITRLVADLDLARGQVAIGTDVNGMFALPAPPDPADAEARVSTAPGLAASTLGSKTWVYNTDGVAHYGLFPEFIASARGAGMSAAAADGFLASAEFFARTWEKAERRRTTVTP
jgi:microsomal dipeptidase-like Zn-dependent dipeptidase